jgi:acetyl esterase/lipase
LVAGLLALACACAAGYGLASTAKHKTTLAKTTATRAKTTATKHKTTATKHKTTAAKHTTTAAKHTTTSAKHTTTSAKPTSTSAKPTSTTAKHTTTGAHKKKPLPPPGPLPVRVHKNVVYGLSANGTPLTADVYSPRAVTSPAPVLIVIHGGGFTHGNKKQVAQYTGGLASNGYVAIAINFALITPGYPEQVRETRLAVSWSIANAQQYGGDPHRLGLIGFSAGGYLAAMAGVLDSGLPGRPVKAVATYSAPLDLPVLDRLLRTRVKACGHRQVCRKVPGVPPLAEFGPLVDFLGCPKGKCSNQLVRNASPSSHVTSKAPAFLMFNSAHETIPTSQPRDMAGALRAAGVPAQVVIVPGRLGSPGSKLNATYVSGQSPTLINFLARQLAPSRVRFVGARKAAPSSTPDWLIILCVVVAAISLCAVLLATRRRAVGHR